MNLTIERFTDLGDNRKSALCGDQWKNVECHAYRRVKVVAPEIEHVNFEATTSVLCEVNLI